MGGKKKTMRHYKKNRKDKVIRFRVSAKDLKMMSVLARQKGESLSGLIYQTLQEGLLSPKPQAEPTSTLN
jgi:hypothetical protein